jgi:hypothetical protein
MTGERPTVRRIQPAKCKRAQGGSKVNAHEPAVSQEEIARRAYEIWQSRGCPSSDGTEEWQAAEAELLAARVARNGSTRERVQSWWSRVLKKGKRQESH